MRYFIYTHIYPVVLATQAATLKALEERVVRRETLVRKERGEWMESLSSDHQENQDSLDLLGHRVRHVCLIFSYYLRVKSEKTECILKKNVCS